MNVYTIGPDIRAQWHWVQPELDKVLADHPSGYESHHYLADIEAGRAMILVITGPQDALCVSLLAEQPNALHVVSASGQGLQTWGHVAEQVLTEIARNMGVEYITSHARKGWAKLQTERNGWTEREVYITRQV
jgi:hypothetical protein